MKAAEPSSKFLCRRRHSFWHVRLEPLDEVNAGLVVFKTNACPLHHAVFGASRNVNQNVEGQHASRLFDEDRELCSMDVAESCDMSQLLQAGARVLLEREPPLAFVADVDACKPLEGDGLERPSSL